VLSHPRPRQGVPQGSVLVPLFFIDSIATDLPPEVFNAIFADDVSLWATDHNKEVARARLQQAVERVSEWAKSKKMLINCEKSEVTFFSNDSHESKWIPEVRMGERTMPFNPSPKFLGVYLDRTLAFTKQVVEVTKNTEAKVRMLAALSSKTWGWKKHNLRRVYLATMRSLLDYAAPGWQPWLSDTQLEALDKAESKALRCITGQACSTPPGSAPHRSRRTELPDSQQTIHGDHSGTSFPMPT
jgi:hypothetical protein